MLTLEVFYGIGALALLGGLIWGMIQYKRRNRANDPITEAATRAEYDRAEGYTSEQESFRKQVRPS